MMNILNQILSGNYKDSETGDLIKLPVRSVVVDKSVGKYSHDLVKDAGISGKLCVVNDENTKDLVHLNADYVVTLDGNAKATDDNVLKVMNALGKCDAAIAVGSGAINDICKYASYKLNKPYAVFGTAPSMNGYLSANASIAIGGHKKTLPAHMPQGVFLDLEILANAPSRLIKSGLGDSLCRSTAQADWLLSSMVSGTNYKQTPFNMLAAYENDLFDNSKALVSGDREIIKLLADTLLLSGIGMYICQGSYPASQGEHMIAHTMEMVFGDEKNYHGEQIGVTTIIMARLQEEIISKESSFFAINPDYKSIIESFYGSELAISCIQEYEKKVLLSGKIEIINNNIQKNWADIQNKISEIIVPSKRLEEVLKNSYSPYSPSHIGWGSEQVNACIRNAKYSRSRFTFLDLTN